MIWEILCVIGFAISIFFLGYNIAMAKICKCMGDVFNAINANKADPQFLKGVFFVSDYLKQAIK